MVSIHITFPYFTLKTLVTFQMQSLSIICEKATFESFGKFKRSTCVGILPLIKFQTAGQSYKRKIDYDAFGFLWNFLNFHGRPLGECFRHSQQPPKYLSTNLFIHLSIFYQDNIHWIKHLSFCFRENLVKKQLAQVTGRQRDILYQHKNNATINLTFNAMFLAKWAFHILKTS